MRPALALVLVFLVRPVPAQQLRFDPAQPQQGGRVTVAYEPITALARESRLLLRAHYRTIHGEAHTTPPSTPGALMLTVAALQRSPDGRFKGSFNLPDSVVYATFSVENTTGSVVDDYGTRLWELLRHAPDGRPAIDALEQRVNDLVGRNSQEAFATARRMTELYPDRAQAWAYLRHFEELLLGAARADSIKALQAARIARLSDQYRTQKPSAHELGYMSFYTSVAGVDSATVHYWLARAQQEAPANALSLFRRGDVFFARYMRDPPQLLREFESLWRDAGPALNISFVGTSLSRAMVGTNFSMARSTGDTAAITRWAERYAARGRYNRRSAALQLVRLPAFRERGMNWLRSELRTLAQKLPQHRYLGETLAEQERRHAREARPLLAALGRALIAQGQIKAGLDTLKRADDGTWDLELYRASAPARLSAGDTAGALRMYALMLADPRTTAAARDSIPPQAQEYLAWARAELPRRVLAQTLHQPLRSPVSLVDTAGATHDLRALATGPATLMVYWSRFCGHSVAELPAIQALAVRLVPMGVRVITITSEAWSPALRDWIRDRKLALPVYSDPTNSLKLALNAWATPAYWLLDAQGDVRFTFDKLNGPRILDELVVQAFALTAR